MYFEIRRASGGQYYAVIRQDNGQIIFTSEAYYSKADALAVIDALKKNTATAEVNDRT